MNNMNPPSCPCQPDKPMKKYQSVDHGPLFGCYRCGHYCMAVFPLMAYDGIVLFCNYPPIALMKMAPHHDEPSLN